LHIFRKFSTVQKNAPLYFCTPPSRIRSAKIKPECKNKAQRFFAYIQEIQHGAKKTLRFIFALLHEVFDLLNMVSGHWGLGMMA